MELNERKQSRCVSVAPFPPPLVPLLVQIESLTEGPKPKNVVETNGSILSEAGCRRREAGEPVVVGS